jgi:hypothetical protein
VLLGQVAPKLRGLREGARTGSAAKRGLGPVATQVAGEVGRPAEGFGAQGASMGPKPRVAQPVPGEVVREAEEAATGGTGKRCPRSSSAPPATTTASTTTSATATASATVRWAALGRWRGLRIHACGEKEERWGAGGGKDEGRKVGCGREMQRLRQAEAQPGKREESE